MKSRRVYEWSSSINDPDGIVGDDHCHQRFQEKIIQLQQHKSNEIKDEQTIAPLDSTTSSRRSSSNMNKKVMYVLSDKNWEGFGDQVWASSRHVANLLADPIKCQDLLLLRNSTTTDAGADFSSSSQQHQQHYDQKKYHPLMKKKFLELGAGAGIPSWIAYQCGCPHVICTDQKVPNRIRCLAESAERNYRLLQQQKQQQQRKCEEEKTNCTQNNDTNSHSITIPLPMRICPYDWGDPIDQVTKALSLTNVEEEEKNIIYDKNNDDNTRNQEHHQQNYKFDIIVAADCCYMPWLHSKLIDSINMLLCSSGGVALLSFALHGNVNDDEVWGIVDVARSKGFHVDILDSIQLTPQKINMDLKQALVHMIRLTRKEE